MTGHIRRIRRSKLFVPGNRPDLMRKAADGDADMLSFDLEDAVPADEKQAAREAVAAFLTGLARTDKVRIVRVNALQSGLMLEDLLAVVGSDVDVINIPKVEDPKPIHVAEEVVRHLERRQKLDARIEILPTLETPAGIRRALEIATASPRVSGLQLGVGDLSAALDATPSSSSILAWARAALLYAAAEAGVEAYDSAYIQVSDLDGFAVECAEGRAAGFTGRSCIHPRQVPIANAAFTPSHAELREAADAMAAYERALARGIGAITHNGRLIDTPIYEQARRLVELGRRSGINPNDQPE